MNHFEVLSRYVYFLDSASPIDYILKTGGAVKKFDQLLINSNMDSRQFDSELLENIEDIFQKVYRTLKQDGTFLFNIEHPVFTAGVGQDWVYTDEGTPQYWPVDRYFIPGALNTHFLGCDVVKQHHTLTQILMGLLHYGFELKAVVEAEPPAEMLDIPGMRDELRRPMMLLVKAAAKK